VPEVLSWHTCCGCDLGDGWAEAMLSYRLPISEFLAEECEAVDEVRPPRRVVRISGCIGAMTGASLPTLGRSLRIDGQVCAA
jgi:hypothetical protein